MDTDDLTAPAPSSTATYSALRRLGVLLERRYCYAHDGRYHFALADGWSIAVTPEPAQRFRIEACRWTVPTQRMWALAEDEGRLAGLVLGLADEIAVLV